MRPDRLGGGDARLADPSRAIATTTMALVTLSKTTIRS